MSPAKIHADIALAWAVLAGAVAIVALVTKTPPPVEWIIPFIVISALHSCTSSILAAMSGPRRRSSARYTSGYLEG